MQSDGSEIYAPDCWIRDIEGGGEGNDERIVPAVWLRPGRSWHEGSAAC